MGTNHIKAAVLCILSLDWDELNFDSLANIDGDTRDLGCREDCI